MMYQRVKGKQVKFLYDLVTVMGEQEAIVICTVTDNLLGRLLFVKIPESGNLPFIGTGKIDSRSRGIDRTVFRHFFFWKQCLIVVLSTRFRVEGIFLPSALYVIYFK